MSAWLLAGVALVLALAWYLSFSASRLDRLHHRVEGARAILDTQLVRRAEAAVEVASSGLVDPAASLLVASAASDALAAGEEEEVDAEGLDRETAESDLSHTLRVALEGAPPHELLSRLGSATHRVQLARRFHNQAVSDTQRVRRKRVVRWAHLAGRAALPQTFEMDDEPPQLPASLGASPGQ